MKLWKKVFKDIRDNMKKSIKIFITTILGGAGILGFIIGLEVTTGISWKISLFFVLAIAILLVIFVIVKALISNVPSEKKKLKEKYKKITKENRKLKEEIKKLKK